MCDRLTELEMSVITCVAFATKNHWQARDVHSRRLRVTWAVSGATQSGLADLCWLARLWNYTGCLAWSLPVPPPDKISILHTGAESIKHRYLDCIMDSPDSIPNVINKCKLITSHHCLHPHTLHTGNCQQGYKSPRTQNSNSIFFSKTWLSSLRWDFSSFDLIILTDLIRLHSSPPSFMRLNLSILV